MRISGFLFAGALMACAPAAVFAQAADDPPELPPVGRPGGSAAGPVMTMSPPGTDPAPQLSGREAAVAQGLTQPAVPQAQAQAAYAPAPVPRARVHAKPPPATISTRPGVNTVFGIAEGHLNRIITPFKAPIVKTTSLATTSVESNIVYVATGTSEPVGLYIHDASDPVAAISVTLVPSDIPPVSVDIQLTGVNPAHASDRLHRAGDERLARGWETEQPFVESLTATFKELALGRVPDGYSLSSISGWPTHARSCIPAGLQAQPRQLVAGFNMDVVVARAVNRTQSPVEATFSNTSCGDLAVLAATTWPSTPVCPGQAVELYVAYRKVDDTDPGTVRPSLIGGAP